MPQDFSTDGILADVLFVDFGLLRFRVDGDDVWREAFCTLFREQWRDPLSYDDMGNEAIRSRRYQTQN